MMLPVMLLDVLFIVFITVTAIQLFYYWGVFSRLAFYRNKNNNHQKQPVSVVICARNEYFNLKDNLPLILEQDYPDFEVVVVNHCSDDDTSFLLETFSRKYNHLSIVTIKEDLNFFKGKKFPLSVGIKSAKNELLLLTDADCKPASNQWLSNMQNNFTEHTDIVLGYGSYEKRKGLLNHLILYDTFHIAMQYFSFALMGKAYMGVGRNLAYRKSLFYKNKGFTAHYKISSGDDDLFINRAATNKNVRIEVSHESHTLSTPKTLFINWVKQKKRHLTTARYYKFSHKFLLGLFSLSQFLFYLLFIALISLCYNWIIVLSLFGGRLISQLIIFKKCTNKLNEKEILLSSPLIEVFFILFYSALAFLNLFSKKNKWT